MPVKIKADTTSSHYDMVDLDEADIECTRGMDWSLQDRDIDAGESLLRAKILRARETERIERTEEDGAGVIPYSILMCWDLLRRSDLSPEAFQYVVGTAADREKSTDKTLRPLVRGSLAAFLRFWEKTKKKSAEPELGVNPKGHLQAEWYKDLDNLLVLQFQSNGDIFFSLWQEGDPTEGKKSSRNVPELIRILQIIPDNPLSWTDAT